MCLPAQAALEGTAAEHILWKKECGVWVVVGVPHHQNQDWAGNWTKMTQTP